MVITQRVNPIWLAPIAGSALLFALVLLLNPSAAASDWGTWQRYMESGQRVLDHGMEASAEYWFRKAAQEAEQLDPRDPRLIQSLRRLVDLYRNQGRHREAAALVRRLETLGGPSPGGRPDPSAVLTALERYAALLRQIGRDRDAATVTARIERLRAPRSDRGWGGLLFFSPVAELREYARLLRQQKRDADAHRVEVLAAAEARAQVERYARLRRDIVGRPELPSFTWERQIVAGSEALEGRLYPEAEALFTDAVKTAETFGLRDVRLAFSLSRLAVPYAAQGKRAAFERTVQRATAILEQTNAAHSLVGPTLEFLVLAHLRFNVEPARTLAYLGRSLPIASRHYVADHPLVGLHLAGLAAAYLAQGERDRAMPYLQRAVAIAERQYLKEHVALAIGLMAVVHAAWDRGDYRLAGWVVQRVVAILERMLDPDHPDVVAAVEMQQLIRQKAERPPEAVSLATATVVPVQVVGNAMLVHALINGVQRALLVVDTGASTTVIRPLLLYRLGMTIPAEARRERVTLAGGQRLEVPFVMLGSVALGKARIENLEAAVAEVFPSMPDVDGLLGADFLQRFRIVLDKPAQRMTLEPLSR